MIKFSEVKPGQIFTFSYYHKKNYPIENEFLWVFVKINDTDFITIYSFSKYYIGKVYSYDKNDDSSCLLLNATFDDFIENT
jgi:hypothetical protein